MLDHERIYQLTHEGRWAELLALIHEHPHAAAQDELVQRALEIFEEAFFEQLDDDALKGGQAEVLERLILLHSGGIYPLEEERFATLVTRLVGWHLEAGNRKAAYQYAQFCPDREPCASLVQQRRPPATLEARCVEVDHPGHSRVQVTVTTPASLADHSVSLFKSPQEKAFFRAVREVFPAYTPYANVALSSLFDFEAIRSQLAPDERTYFFKAVVDCVVFDQHDEYRPVHFFELDSGLHDVLHRRENDASKDRIVTAAGHRLYRIRPRTVPITKDEFVTTLHAIFGTAHRHSRRA